MIKKINFSKTNYIFIFLVAVLMIGAAIFYFFYYQNQPRIYVLKRFTDLNPLIEKAATSRFVLLGESSHGTAEYYKWRAVISQELIKHHQFSLVVVEGDWDALYQINLYVKQQVSPLGGAREILNQFSRWPTWMWANEEFLEFVEWLRLYNSYQLPEDMIGIYGKDIYGGSNSINLVLNYLSQQASDLELRAKDNYDCLANYSYDWQNYVYQLSLGQKNCQQEVKAVVDLLMSSNLINDQAYFNALQNAWVVVHAEEHYRANLFGDANSWNARVLGMKNIFQQVAYQYGLNSKAIIWAHNTHIGDARATEMEAVGMLNIGQLLREKYGPEKIFAVGFGTYEGTVMAGLNWGGSPQVLSMPPAQKSSLEDFLAQKNKHDFFILLDDKWQKTPLGKVLGHRAKGVVYNPINDSRQYVNTLTTNRYDAFIFFHQTKALTPLK